MSTQHSPRMQRTPMRPTPAVQTADMSASARPTVHPTAHPTTSARWLAEPGVFASFPAPVCPTSIVIDYGTGTNGFKRHHQRPEETFL